MTQPSSSAGGSPLLPCWLRTASWCVVRPGIPHPLVFKPDQISTKRTQCFLSNWPTLRPLGQAASFPNTASLRQGLHCVFTEANQQWAVTEWLAVTSRWIWTTVSICRQGLLPGPSKTVKINCKIWALCNKVGIPNFRFYRIFFGGSEGSILQTRSAFFHANAGGSYMYRWNLCTSSAYKYLPISNKYMCFARQAGKKAVISPSGVSPHFSSWERGDMKEVFSVLRGIDKFLIL